MIKVKELQKVTLDISDIVIRLCEEEGIRYYLAEGTLLGCLRHGGFIPWDEDVDLAIPRQDYDRLLPLLREKLPEGYRLVEYTTCADHPRYFAQVERLDTPVCEDAFVTPFMRHMWIDLFPVDGMPANPLRRKLHLYRLLYLRVRAQLANANEGINSKRPHATLRKLAIQMGNLMAKVFRMDPRRCTADMERAARKYDAAVTGWTISLGSLYKGRTVFPTAYYGAGRTATFEGRNRMIPEQAEAMLTSLYGDYMTPPPPEAQKGHDLITVEEFQSAHQNAKTEATK